MALCAASQEAPFARVAGVQLRGSRCGLRSVALAAPKRLTFSRVAFGQSGGVQSKKGSATASAKMTEWASWQTGPFRSAPASDASGAAPARVGRVSRETKETSVFVEINIDGTGICNADSGIPFLDHMLDQIASHGLFDVTVKAKGDLHIDDHHTNEDIGLAFGQALSQALGDRKGIHRFGDFSAPLDEALIHVVLDLSGRPHLGFNCECPTERIGNYDTQLFEHFFQSLVNTSGMTLHIRKLDGKNSHHIVEATFKAFARALRKATEVDPRRVNTVPSSKGVLTQK